MFGSGGASDMTPSAGYPCHKDEPMPVRFQEIQDAFEFVSACAKVNTASFLPEERALMAQAGERPLQ